MRGENAVAEADDPRHSTTLPSTLNAVFYPGVQEGRRAGVQSVRSRRSFISSPLWTPYVYGPTSEAQKQDSPVQEGRRAGTRDGRGRGYATGEPQLSKQTSDATFPRYLTILPSA